VTEPPVVLLGRDEAAKRLNVSPRTVRRYEGLGLLDARKIGPRLVKITEASVEALIAGRDRKAVAA
jgi:excisionase family DNA binding protein